MFVALMWIHDHSHREYLDRYGAIDTVHSSYYMLSSFSRAV